MCVCMFVHACVSCRIGAFSGVRLLRGKATDAVLPQLTQQLARDLIRNPPYELRWLEAYRDQVIHYKRYLEI